MRIRTYHPQLSFSGAPEASDFKALSQQGYCLIVNNRPDEEPGEYLDHQQEKALRAMMFIPGRLMPVLATTAMAW